MSTEERLDRIERDLAVLRSELAALRTSAGTSTGPSADHVRRLEARFDARLQEVHARIVLHDGRFAAMGGRVNRALVAGIQILRQLRRWW